MLLMTATPVALFVQCLVDALYPEVGEAMVRVFDRLGVPLVYPEAQTCCGQPAYNSGRLHEATAAAQRFIELFEDAEAIVCPSGSCVAMVRRHYPELFAHQPIMRERALQVARKTFEFSEYLVNVLGVVDLGAAFSGIATYHDSCHLARTLGIREQPRQLLRHVRGLSLAEMDNSDTCCGFGGTFSVNYPDISVALADDKIDNILNSGATLVVGCDVSCLMNIRGRMSRRGVNLQVLHLAQVLAGKERA
jgi:L-lactate dehydrogenase complex protein LldE